MTEYELMTEIQDKLTISIMEMMDKAYKDLNLHDFTPGIAVDTSNSNITVTLPEASHHKGYSYKVTSVNAKCDHKWQTYDSGWSKYDFCSKCDEKRNM